MAVLVKKADGQSKRFADTETTQFQYRTTDSGVLRIIQIEGVAEALTQEYSPAGWSEVKGERYLSEVGSGLRSSNSDPKEPVKRRAFTG